MTRWSSINEDSGLLPALGDPPDPPGRARPEWVWFSILEEDGPRPLDLRGILMTAASAVGGAVLVAAMFLGTRLPAPPPPPPAPIPQPYVVEGPPLEPPAAPAPEPVVEVPRPAEKPPEPEKPPPAPEPAPVAVAVKAEPPTREAAEYRALWETAVARAARREYDAAAVDLRRASRRFQEEPVRREADGDVEDLRRVGALHDAIVKAISGLTRGVALALEVRNPSGDAVRVVGGVVEAGPERVELRPENARETVFVEAADATAASLAEQAPGDDRTAAMFCLIDGDAAAAQSRLGGRTDAVPAKYWERAAKTGPRKPDVTAVEQSARHLLYAAEREYRRPGLRGLAAEKYKTLLKDYAELAVVARSVARLTLRAQAGREYFLTAAEAYGGGTFERRESARFGGCWAAKAESDFSRGHENFVEFEFYALAGEAYRAWVLVGGEAAAEFTPYWQATDLAAPDPRKPGATVRVEPGTKYGLTLRGVRSPGAEWMDLALPKFAVAGVKRFRLLATQQGLTVARAVVSSSRTAPPSDADLKDLEAARAAETAK